MRKLLFSSIFTVICAIGCFAQFEGIKPNLAAGEITSIREADNRIGLKTKDGAIEIVLSNKTVYKRVPPENPNPAAAIASSISEINVGDKVLVTGTVSADKLTIPAKTIYLITKADISKKQQTDQEKWKTRGIAGKVILLNPQLKEVTISVRGATGDKNVVLMPKQGVAYRRYAPDSVRFSDAKAGNFDELKIGDQVRALGDKSEDGSSFKAEEIVSGSFRMVGGKITAIDTEKKEITITDVQSNKPVVIALSDLSTLKNFPAEMAQLTMMRMMGGSMQATSGTGVRPPNQPQPPTSATTGQPKQGSAAPQIDEMLDKFPTITLAEMKIGDSIAASGTNGTVPNKITAIKLLTGVEIFLSTPQIAGGGGRGRTGGGGGDFSIPGLDGIGTP